MFGTNYLCTKIILPKFCLVLATFFLGRPIGSSFSAD